MSKTDYELEDDATETLRRKCLAEQRQLRSRAAGILSAAAREKRAATLAEDVAVEAAYEELDRVEARLSRLPKAAPERPADPTYRQGGAHSYFADLVARHAPTPVPGLDPHAAERRLEQSAKETATHARLSAELEARKVNNSMVQYRGQSGELLQARDLSYASGSGAGFVNPVHLSDQFKLFETAEAPLVANSTRSPMPDGTWQLVIPEVTGWAGAQVAPALQNTPLLPDGAVTSSLESFVSLLVTYTVFSLQALQRAGQAVNTGTGSSLDQLITQQAAVDLAGQSEYLSFYGGGDSAAEPVGIASAMTNGGVNLSTAGAAAQWEAIAGAAAEVGNTRLRYPTDAYMAPRRAAYLLGYEDGSGFSPSNRPGTGPGGESPYVSNFAGLRVWADGALPTTLTIVSTSTYDEVYVGRSKELLTFASEPVHDVFEDSYGTALSVVVRTRVYFASILQYPTAFARAYGTSFNSF